MKSEVLHGLCLCRFDGMAALPGVETFVTTRHYDDGSDADMGIYATADVARVETNLARLCNALEIPRGSLLFPQQTHGNAVAVIDEAVLSLAPDERRTVLYGKDALVTALPHVAVAVATADCVPLLLADPVSHAVAAIHAGWRGTVAKIVCETIAVMAERYASCPADLYAAMGPCISAGAYEVGDEVVDRFVQAGFDPEAVVVRPFAGAKAHIDLPAANTALLLQCGVPLQHIQVCGVCTYASCDTFYSVRATGGSTGRFLTGILMRG